MAHNYPLSSISDLRQQFVGQTLTALPTPSVLLDRSRIRRNCTAMLEVCERLGVGFRAHVKSHKTLELSRLMVGDGLGRDVPANFIVSTVAEAENLREYVKSVQGEGREGSVSLVFFMVRFFGDSYADCDV